MGDVWSIIGRSNSDLFQIASNRNGFLEYRIVFSWIFNSIYGRRFVMASARTIPSISDVASLGGIGVAGWNAFGIVSCRIFRSGICHADVVRSRSGVLLFNSRRLAAVQMGGARMFYIVFYVSVILGAGTAHAGTDAALGNDGKRLYAAADGVCRNAIRKRH